MHRIAIISDSHNLLRPEVLAVINTCEIILHAGDISKPEILDRLRGMKQVFAVRGNNDRGSWTADIPEYLDFDLFGCRIYMAHIKRNIPTDHGAQLVISGHSHRYSCVQEKDAIYLNPGSCGPRRFNQDITMAILTIDDEKKNPHLPTGISIERIDIPHEGIAAQNRP